MRSKKTRPDRRGFSLLELLLVTALLPVISFAVFANFSSGMRIWKALVQESPQEDISIFYQKVSVDFMNALKYTDIPFTGDKDRVTLATRIDADPKLGGDRGIGRVSFFYDPRERAIFKEEEDISRIYKETAPQKVLMIKGVASFEVNYFFFHSQDKTFSWENEWEPKKDVLPVAARFIFDRDGAGKTALTFFIPVGGE
jgi:prepilin-type N-terminal cleavage/methylation domain-containing protein